MTEPSVLTVILNWRTPDMTLDAAAAAMTAMDGLRGEIVIVDNDSRDGSFERLSAAAEENGWTRNNRLRVIRAGHNGGFGAGMNFGMAAGLSAGGAPDFYYLLNSDAFPAPGAIRVLRDYLMARPDAGIAGSRIHGPDGTPHETAFRFPSIAGELEATAHTGPISRLLSRWRVTLGVPDRSIQVDWIAGASMMLRREILVTVGGFDEGYFLYFEETDLCRRAARAGWSTHYVPESDVTHIGSVSTGMNSWERTPQFWLDSRLRYFVQNHGAAYAALATAAAAAGGSIWKIRQWLTRAPDKNRRYFVTDLLRHSLTARARAFSPRSSPRFPKPLAEEGK